MTLPPNLATRPPTVWEQANAYAKHSVAVAAGIAVSLGVLDPATNEIHVSGAHSVYLVLIGTGVALALSYAGLGAPAAAKVVYVGVLPPSAVPALPAAAPGLAPPPPDGQPAASAPLVAP